MINVLNRVQTSGYMAREPKVPQSKQSDSARPSSLSLALLLWGLLTPIATIGWIAAIGWGVLRMTQWALS